MFNDDPKILRLLSEQVKQEKLCVCGAVPETAA
jgi:hypothetical protein